MVKPGPAKNQFKGLEDFNLPKPGAVDVSNAEQEAKVVFADLENERYRQDTNHRSALIVWASTLVSFWLVGVFLILVNNTSFYKLDNSVLITLLSTTTVNVLGLMVIVLSDLFKHTPKKAPASKPKKSKAKKPIE